MNINDISAKRNCTSCQMCAAVCPKDAININMDADGFYRPNVNDDLCVDCGLCTKVCYKFENEIADYGVNKLANTILYGASAKDPDIVKSTTSGGIADLMAHKLIKEGYKCVGVVYDSDRDAAIDTIAETEDKLLGFRGSKYIQSYTVEAFKQIVRTCKTEKYAVFGTPCQIFALDKYLRQRKVRDNHILIDLYCHGCPSMNIWKKYIKEIKKKISSDVVDNVNFRSKVKGWGNFYVVVDIAGKPVFYSNNRHNEFFDLFFSDQVLNEACNDCKLRGTLEYTDIRLGDFWGKQYVLNSKGVSAVSLVSNKAKILFNSISNHVDYQEETYQDFLPWQSWGKAHHPKAELRKLLLEQLRNDKISLQESIDTIHKQQGIKRKIVRYGKMIVHTLPLSWEKIVRWIFYKL